jgi:hypothetical protein
LSEESRHSGDVSALIRKLDPGREKLIDEIRSVVLESSPEITEHIKWNSPAYHYKGGLLIDDPRKYSRDILVFNLRNAKHILLIFPSGALVHGVSPILTGDYADGRRMVNIATMKELEESAVEIKKVINAWIEAVRP